MSEEKIVAIPVIELRRMAVVAVEDSIKARTVCEMIPISDNTDEYVLHCVVHDYLDKLEHELNELLNTLEALG